MAIQEVASNSQINQARAGEEQNDRFKVWRRTKRFFNHEGRWYFQTREGVDVGPYQSFLDAEIEVNILIGKLRGAASSRAIEVIKCHKSIGVSSGYLNAPEFTGYVIETDDMDSTDLELIQRFLKVGIEAA